MIIRNYEEKELNNWDDAYDELEAIRAQLRGAKRKINRNKLEASEIDFQISLVVEQ